MKKFVNWLKNEESGQGMVEYALIIALVSIVAIAALIFLGDEIIAIFDEAGTSLESR